MKVSTPVETPRTLSQRVEALKKRLLGKTKTVAARAPSIDRRNNSIKGRSSSIDNKKHSAKLEGGSNGGIEACEDKAAHLDSTWSWVVLGAAIFTTIFSASINTSFSILFGEKLKDMEMSATVISWTYNVHLFIWYMDTCLSGPLTQKFGWRAASLPAALITAIIYGIFPFVTSQIAFFFMYSVVLGIAGGICYQVTFLILPAYFQRHRGLALCLNSASNSIGQMLIPQLIRVLTHRFGTNGTIFVYSGILFFMCAAAALYRPIDAASSSTNKGKKPDNCLEERRGADTTEKDNIEAGGKNWSTPKQSKSTEQKDNGIKTYFVRCFTSLKMPTVLILGFSYGMFLVGHMNFTMLIPFIVTEAGYTTDDASYCLSTYAISNLIARLTNTFLSDRSFFNAKFVYMSGGISAAVVCVVFSKVMSSWQWALVSLACYGFGSGVTSSIYRVLLLQTVGMEAYPSSMAGAGTISAFLFLTVAPLLGVARDYSATFTLSMLMAASLKLASALLWLLLPAARRYEARAAGLKGGATTGDVKTGNVKTGNVKTGNVKTGKVKTGNVTTGGTITGGCKNEAFVGDDDGAAKNPQPEGSGALEG